MARLTPWFPGDVKPARRGLYETDPRDGYQCFQYWNGRFWGLACHNPEHAFKNKNAVSAFQNDKWRGLAKEPK